MTPKDIFEKQIAERLSDDAAKAAVKDLDAVYQFHITGDDGGDWYIDCRDGTVKGGTDDDADCTITVADEDFVNLVTGATPGPQLFMMGKLQIAGNMSLAMKLSQVLGT